MKRFLALVLFLSGTVCAFGQQGYNIKIVLKPFRNSTVYLGYYYGKMKALADSVLLDDHAEGSFKGNESLPGGIYFVVSPKKEILFELLIDKQQQFSIEADTSNLPFSVRFTGTPENRQFQEYSHFAGNIGSSVTKINEEYKTAKNHTDSIKIASRIKILNDQLISYRDSISKKNDDSFLSLLFKGMREPKIPQPSSHPGGKYDSNYAYQYYKSHYWDGISFADERMVRTPFFEPKLVKYYQDLVVPHPDSIKKEVDGMLLYARTSKEMFRYLLVHFVQQYINPQFMGQDAVFVHIFEKYINSGQADFFTPQYKEFMTKRAYSLMANLIGQPAANMVMVDSSDRALPLYKLKSEFIVICFWDPTCGHCKEVLPKVDSIFQAKWKKEGVQLYGVKVDGSKDEWIKFIHEHHLNGWQHVYQLPSQEASDNSAGRPGYRQLYDVYQTPVLYLLDKDKRIIAKKLNYLQMDEVIDLKIKNSKSN